MLCNRSGTTGSIRKEPDNKISIGTGESFQNRNCLLHVNHLSNIANTKVLSSGYSHRTAFGLCLSKAEGMKLKTGTVKDYVIMAHILLFIIVLSTIDGVMTIAWVNNGHAVERNPYMAELIAGKSNMIPFMVVKTILVVGGCAVLWKQREKKLAVIGTFLIFLIFSLLFIYHMEFWSTLFTQWRAINL